MIKKLVINNKNIVLIGEKKSMIWQNGKLKLHSKKLASGKCQIKFHWNGKNMDPVYGYLLTDGDRTFRDVIREIRREVDKVRKPDWYYHRHLYQLGYPPEYRRDLIIYKDKNNNNSC